MPDKNVSATSKKPRRAVILAIFRCVKPSFLKRRASVKNVTKKPRSGYIGEIEKPKTNPKKERVKIVKTPNSKEKAVFRKILSIRINYRINKLCVKMCIGFG